MTYLRLDMHEIIPFLFSHGIEGIHHLRCPKLIFLSKTKHFFIAAEPCRLPFKPLMVFPVNRIIGKGQYTFSDKNKVASVIQTVCVGMHPKSGVPKSNSSSSQRAVRAVNVPPSSKSLSTNSAMGISFLQSMILESIKSRFSSASGSFSLW